MSIGGSVFVASEREPARVLIAGGGVAAIQGLLALREIAPATIDLELLAPDPELGRLDELAAANGARYRAGALEAVDPHKRLATTRDGKTIGYDALLVAIGGTSRSALSGALTLGSTRDAGALQQLLSDVAAGSVRSIAFALPPAVRWSLPLYELALTTAARVAALDVQVRIELVTHERAPLAVLGPGASRRMRSLLSAAGIRLRTNSRTLVAQPRRLFVAGGAIAADRVVALGSLAVARIEGLPQRHRGFIPVDEHMRVEGAPRIYAAGDATWHPLKHGAIAAQQARAAAAAIAADAGVAPAPEPFAPVLDGIFPPGDAQHFPRDERPALAIAGKH